MGKYDDLLVTEQPARSGKYSDLTGVSKKPPAGKYADLVALQQEEPAAVAPAPLAENDFSGLSEVGGMFSPLGMGGGKATGGAGIDTVVDEIKQLPSTLRELPGAAKEVLTNTGKALAVGGTRVAGSAAVGASLAPQAPNVTMVQGPSGPMAVPVPKDLQLTDEERGAGEFKVRQDAMKFYGDVTGLTKEWEEDVNKFRQEVPTSEPLIGMFENLAMMGEVAVASAIGGPVGGLTGYMAMTANESTGFYTETFEQLKRAGIDEVAADKYAAEYAVKYGMISGVIEQASNAYQLKGLIGGKKGAVSDKELVSALKKSGAWSHILKILPKGISEGLEELGQGGLSNHFKRKMADRIASEQGLDAGLQQEPLGESFKKGTGVGLLMATLGLPATTKRTESIRSQGLAPKEGLTPQQIDQAARDAASPKTTQPQEGVTTPEGRPVTITQEAKVDDQGQPISTEQPAPKPQKDKAVYSPPADAENAGAAVRSTTFTRDDGKVIQGEIIEETDATIEFRDTEGVNHRIPRKVWEAGSVSETAADDTQTQPVKETATPAQAEDAAPKKPEPAPQEGKAEDAETPDGGVSVLEAERDHEIPLGLNRKPVIDSNLTAIETDEFDSQFDKVERELIDAEKSIDEAFDTDRPMTMKERKDLAELQDRLTSYELEKYRRQLEWLDADDIVHDLRFLNMETDEGKLKATMIMSAANQRGLGSDIEAAIKRRIGSDPDTAEVWRGILEDAKAVKKGFDGQKSSPRPVSEPKKQIAKPTAQAPQAAEEPAAPATYRTIAEAKKATGANSNRIEGEAGKYTVRTQGNNGVEKIADTVKKSTPEKKESTEKAKPAKKVKAIQKPTKEQKPVEEAKQVKPEEKKKEATPKKKFKKLTKKQEALYEELQSMTDEELNDRVKELGIGTFDGGKRKQRDVLEEEVLQFGKDGKKKEAFLDRLEREAREEIKTLKKGSVGANAPAGIAANYVVIGAVKITKGTKNFAKWSKEMINEFGDSIKPLLKTIYDSAKIVSDQNKADPDSFKKSVEDEIARLEKRNLSLFSTDEGVREMFAEVDRAREAIGEPSKESFEEWDKKAKERFDASPDGSYLDLVSGKLDMSDPVNGRLAKMVLDIKAKEDLESGDQGRTERAVTAAYNVRHQRSGLARALVAGRDPNQTPAERAQSLLYNLVTTPSNSDMKVMSTVNDKKRMALIKKHAAKTKAIIDELKKSGLSISDIGDLDGMNKRKISTMLRIIHAQKATISDKEFEYWRNAILSAPPTQAANIIGNTFESFYQYALLRPLEASMNLLTGNNIKGATTLSDMKSIYKAVFTSDTWITGWRNAVDAFINEQPVIDGVKIEGSGVAIKGVKGRIIRTPQRMLLAGDEFAKGNISQIEVGAQAAMLGRQQGLKGDALDAFISDQVHDPSSKAWESAMLEARDQTFQASVGDIAKNLMKIRSAKGITGFMARHVIPFIVTPTNLIKKGVRRTPLGSIALPGTINKVRTGEITSHQAMSRVAEQVIAWGLFAVLSGIVNEDDEDGLPKYITGSSPTKKERGKRDFQYRNVPAQSFRIPGSDRWLSYSRIEPMATSLSLMVDMLKTGEGSFAEKTWTSLTGLARDKTFMRGISDLIDVIEKRDTGAVMDWSSNLAASYMPNIVRSTLRADDDTIRQYMIDDPSDRLKGLVKRTGQQMLPHHSLMPPAKVDIFGREIKKDSVTGAPLTDFIYNVTLPVRVNDKKPLMPLDKFLLNYNAKHPEAPYWPTLPSPSYTENGEKKRMTEDQYHDFLVRRGEIIADATTWVGDDAIPTDFLRKRIATIFRTATLAAKAEMRDNQAKQ